MNNQEKKVIRELVAILWCASGCGCCRDSNTWETASAKLAKLLKIPKSKDGSGFDFYKVRDKATKPHA